MIYEAKIERLREYLDGAINQKEADWLKKFKVHQRKSDSHK